MNSKDVDRSEARKAVADANQQPVARNPPTPSAPTALVEKVGKYLGLLSWLGLSSITVVVEKFTGLGVEAKVGVATVPVLFALLLLWQRGNVFQKRLVETAARSTELAAEASKLHQQARKLQTFIEASGEHWDPPIALAAYIGPGNADFVELHDQFAHLVLPIRLINCAPFPITVVHFDLAWEVTADVGGPTKTITSGERSKRLAERLPPGQRFETFDLGSRKERIEATCPSCAGTLSLRGVIVVASDLWDGEGKVPVSECIRVSIVNKQSTKKQLHQPN